MYRARDCAEPAAVETGHARVLPPLHVSHRGEAQAPRADAVAVGRRLQSGGPEGGEGPRDADLLPGSHVVIKSLPNAKVDRLRYADSTATAGYIRELNELFTMETQKLQTVPPMASVARTLDWGTEPIYVPGRRAFSIPFVVQKFIAGTDSSHISPKGVQGHSAAWPHWTNGSIWPRLWRKGSRRFTRPARFCDTSGRQRSSWTPPAGSSQLI